MDKNRLIELLGMWAEKGEKLRNTLSSHLRRFSRLYALEVLNPYREAISRSLHHLESHIDRIDPEARRAWERELKTQQSQWEKRLNHLTEKIRKAEEALLQQEDRVDYRMDFAHLNRELQEKEDTVRLKRDVLSREIFELRVQTESAGGLLEMIWKLPEKRALREKMWTKVEEMESIGRQLQDIRIEWDETRKRHLLTKTDEMERWERNIMELSRMRMEKKHLGLRLKDVAPRWAMHEILKNGGLEILNGLEGIEKVPALLKKQQQYDDGRSACHEVIGFLHQCVRNLALYRTLCSEKEPGTSPLDQWQESDVAEISAFFEGDPVRREGYEYDFENLLRLFNEYGAWKKSLADRLTCLDSLPH